MSTHNKKQFATIVRTKVIFMARPKPTKVKGYREPLVISTKWFPTKSEAMKAAAMWESV